jgi:hypothetical protein
VAYLLRNTRAYPFAFFVFKAYTCFAIFTWVVIFIKLAGFKVALMRRFCSRRFPRIVPDYRRDGLLILEMIEEPRI